MVDAVGSNRVRPPRVRETRSEAPFLDLSSLTTTVEVRSLRPTPGRSLARDGSYPGGKAGAGVAEKLINEMPPHSHYIAPFGGADAVLRKKRPAPGCNGLIEQDPRVVRLWQRSWGPAWREAWPGGDLTIVRGDGALFLKEQAPQLPADAFVYVDPPYLRSARSDKGRIYACEFWTEAEHRGLLRSLKRLPCMVMLSGYASELYTRELRTWRAWSFQAMTRSGRMATEWVWCNFPATDALHDYRYLGEGYRERERIKKKSTRWRRMLEAMPVLERRAILAAISGLAPPAICPTLPAGPQGRRSKQGPK